MVYFPIMRHSRKKNTKTFSSIENISNEGFQLKKRLKTNDDDDDVPLIREITWEKACKKLLFKTTKPWCRFGAKVVPVLMAWGFYVHAQGKTALSRVGQWLQGRGDVGGVCGHLGNGVRAVCEYDRGLPG